MTRSRRVFASLVTLAVVAACGEAPKTPVTKNFARPASTKAAKGIADDAVRHAAFNTGVALSGGLSKGVYEIALGDSRDGVLAEDDETTIDDSGDAYFSDIWVLTLDQDADVEIVMSSSGLDSFLDIDELVGFNEDGSPQVEHLAEDDDGAGGASGLDSGLSGTLAAGTFLIQATTVNPEEAGSYTISVKDVGSSSGGSSGGSSSAAYAGTVQAGGTFSGALSDGDGVLEDGTYYQLVRYHGQAGEHVTVSLTSGDFDTYLLFGQGAGAFETLNLLGQNDDIDASDFNSRVELDLPEDGIYTLVVNTAFPEETGSYTLQVQAGAPDYSRFSAGSTDPDGKYALLVGINDYPGSGSDLVGPTRDADLVAQVLVDSYGFDPANIIMLKNSEATRPNIANGIVRHLGKAGPNGVSFFFYSGHGTRVGGNLGFLDDEADGEDDALYVYGPGGDASVLLDEELGYLFDQLEGNTMVAVDACFSGTISRAAGGQAKRADITDPDVADNIRLPKTFIAEELGTGYAFGTNVNAMANLFNHAERNIVISSSSEEQVSWTVGDWPDGSGPASLFAYFFVNEMRDADNRTTFADILSRVDGQVDQYVRDSGGRYEDQDTQLVGPNLTRSVRAFLKAN